jgi:hypothetical protein
MMDQAQEQQHIVDQAVVLQQSDPGVDTQQERGPERQHDQHQQEGAPRIPGARDGIRHGISDQQTEERGDRRHHDGVEVGAQIERIGEEIRVARQMNLWHRQAMQPADERRVGWNGEPRFRERDLENEQERNDEENREPESGYARNELPARKPPRSDLLPLTLFHDGRLTCQDHEALGIPRQRH